MAKSFTDNFYWHGSAEHPDDLQAPRFTSPVTIEVKVDRHDQDGQCRLQVTLHNPPRMWR